MSPSLEEIADDLYGLLPSAFTTARDERARALRKEGDRALSDQVKQLRRPTTAAWLVNLLARQPADGLEDLLDLGSALRRAQRQLDRDRMRQLSERRHQEVQRLLAEARRLASGSGQEVSEQVLADVQSTLEAAAADEAAAASVASGRLTTALHYAGLGSVDLGGAVAAGSPSRTARAPAAKAPRPPARRAEPQPNARAAADQASRELEAAERAAERARGELRSADHEAQAAEGRLRAARDRQSKARQELRRAEGELRRARRTAQRTGADEG